ncbi:MAG: hypothetical protein HHAS10_06330 [Candidatus Altimarinota bacterium]
MIEESLLFRMGYVFPDIALSDGGISFFIALVLILGYFFVRSKLFSPRASSPLVKLPNIDQDDFEEKLSGYIRHTLAQKYSPEHACSHTVREIEQYAKGDRLITVLRDLERAQYTSKKLTDIERGEILKKVRKK